MDDRVAEIEILDDTLKRSVLMVRDSSKIYIRLAMSR